MAFSGADVAQLRALASRFELQANKLNEIATTSSTAIMVADWTGANIDRVRSEWNRMSKPHLLALADDLLRLSQDLRKQAQQQEEASQGTLGDATPGLPTFPGDVQLPWFPPGFAWPPVFTPGIEWPRWQWPPEPGTDQVPLIPFDRFFWEETERLLNIDVFGSPISVEDLGSFVPGVGTAFDVINIGNAFRQGQVPVHELVDVAAGALRSTGTPITYGVGLAAGIWNDVFEEAGKSDFSQSQLAENWAYIQKDPWGAASGAAEAVVDYLPQLAKNFVFW